MEFVTSDAFIESKPETTAGIKPQSHFIDWEYRDDRFTEGRPEDIFTAFDMQRHYQWDLYLTTPNIAKIKREIREVSEWAYRHRSMVGIVPFFTHLWTEVQHDPENSGKAIGNRVGSPKWRIADPRVFAVYQSTATGEITATQTGTGVFADTAIKFKIFTGLIFLAFFLYMLFFQVFPSHSSQSVPADVNVINPVIAPSTHPSNNGVNSPVFLGQNSTIHIPLALTPSTTHRLVAWVINSDPAKSIFYSQRQGGRFEPIPPYLCYQTQSIWQCVVESTIISPRTGLTVIASSK